LTAVNKLEFPFLEHEHFTLEFRWVPRKRQNQNAISSSFWGLEKVKCPTTVLVATSPKTRAFLYKKEDEK